MKLTTTLFTIGSGEKESSLRVKGVILEGTPTVDFKSEDAQEP